MDHSVDLTGVCSNKKCVYTEHAFRSRLKTWGEGLLDKTLGNDKTILVERDVPSDHTAELFAFGTGRLPDTVLINGNEIGLPSLDVNSTGNKVYSGDVDHSVHRTYHRAVFPADWLARRVNTVTFPRVHAYVLVSAIRIYDDDTSAFRECGFGATQNAEGLVVTPAGRLPEDVHHIDFLGKYTGYDENQNGAVDDWHAGAEVDPASPSSYRLAGHLGTISKSDESITCSTDLLPPGPIEIRARITTKDGTVYEQPSSHRVEIERGNQTLEIIRPSGFSAVGFHENGFNQEAGRAAVGFTIRNIAKASRSVLLYAGYGEFAVLVNGQTVVANTSFPLAVCSQAHVDVELAEGVNTVEYLSLGTTGCFQNPGPMLFVYRRE